MISVSSAFLETMQTRRDFRCRANVTFPDESTLLLTESDFSVSGNHIVTGCGSVSEFPVGNAIGKTAYFELVNHDGSFDGYSFAGAKIDLKLVFALLDGGEELVSMGLFTVTEPETRGHTIQITAYDDMYKADVEYVPTITYPTTSRKMLYDALNVCGIAYQPVLFNETDFTVNAAPDGYTCRQVMAAYAMANGKNIVIGNNMAVTKAFSPMGFPPSVQRKDFFTISTDLKPITITGVSAKVTDVVDGSATTRTILVGEEGYVVSFDNPIWAGSEEKILDETLSRLFVGRAFSRFDGEMAADPRFEFWDEIALVDENGEQAVSFITDVDFSFLGTTEIACRAPDSSSVNGIYKIDRTEQKIEAVTETVAQIKNNGTYLEAIVKDVQGAVSATLSSTEIKAEIERAVGGISSVDTKTGAKLNEDGLTVYKTGNNVKTLISNEGMYVQRVQGDGAREESILEADQDGVNALNLTARKYLTIGNNSRFEDFINEKGKKRTACFWVG